MRREHDLLLVAHQVGQAFIRYDPLCRQEIGHRPVEGFLVVGLDGFGVFAEQHATEGWSGESRRFGEGVAILIGDLAFVYSDRLLANANPTAWSIWNELRIELRTRPDWPQIRELRRALHTSFEALVTALVRGAFEYQGQKCSACSRVRMPAETATLMPASR